MTSTRQISNCKGGFFLHFSVSTKVTNRLAPLSQSHGLETVHFADCKDVERMSHLHTKPGVSSGPNQESVLISEPVYTHPMDLSSHAITICGTTASSHITMIDRSSSPYCFCWCKVAAFEKRDLTGNPSPSPSVCRRRVSGVSSERVQTQYFSKGELGKVGACGPIKIFG